MFTKPTGSYNLSRRGFLDHAAGGVSAAALAFLANQDLRAEGSIPTGDSLLPASGGPRRGFDTLPRDTHHPAKAKAVIQLFMNGGPSQMDLFEPKPILDKHHGEPYFNEIAEDISSPQQAGGLLKSPFKFKQHGESGAWVSDALPELSKVVDNVSFIKSMFNNHPNHEPALFKIHSGRLLPGRPSIGAWVTYGLGSVNQNLPAYVVLDDPSGLPVNTVQSWQNGFLPPLYQGTRVRSQGAPILNLNAEKPAPASVSQLQRDLLRRIDEIHRSKRPNQQQLDARISSYELAARMQLEAEDLLDISRESQQTLTAYGVGDKETDSYGRRCLMARRMVERGVRYVQIFMSAQPWDSHTNLAKSIGSAAGKTDKPVAALVADLKQRGLLDEVLVIWGGEFGRLPIAQLRDKKDVTGAGRDHGPRGFTLWMAGGGIKPGVSYGATDEIGYAAADQPVSIADWHATVLHLLGLDHEKLFYERNGLKEKLTDLFTPKIVNELIT
ncbi:MAG: DUF1501 domain-containing protein [Planctomycetota bacterium]|nr:DUF1501 domain-containing protein [Planctomycetota bacterium]